MAPRFRLQVCTQETELFSRDVVSVILPGVSGYFGVLAHHAPLVAALGEGIMTVRETDDSVSRYGIRGGFAEVAENVVTVLADEVFEPEESAT
ncbi:MAG: ATP synthase F1 subunit epsilon [Candidatus Sumerlaeaceae bacterium]|nr:ATP synthase F1 subunit epsilon [Candidatus Sumerlaeaceae bacterium]